MKKGDKIWVECTLTVVDQDKISVYYGPVAFLADHKDCRLVEPQSVVNQHLTTDTETTHLEDLACRFLGNKPASEMTVRQEIASRIMSGLVADPNTIHMANAADLSIRATDALIKALIKQNG
jgi:hypothetical protein